MRSVRIPSRAASARCEDGQRVSGQPAQAVPGGITFLLRGDDMTSLKRKRLELSTVLLGAGLQPVRPEFEEGPLNSWLRALPMCFNPDSDKNTGIPV